MELRRIGVPFTINDFFATRPNSRPSKIRGGDTFPIAISIAAEQCASICAGFILPHCRSLSGLNCASRSLTSSTVAASNRFFTRKGEPKVCPVIIVSLFMPATRQRFKLHRYVPRSWCLILGRDHSSAIRMKERGRVLVESPPCALIPSRHTAAGIRKLVGRSADGLTLNSDD